MVLAAYQVEEEEPGVDGGEEGGATLLNCSPDESQPLLSSGRRPHQVSTAIKHHILPPRGKWWKLNYILDSKVHVRTEPTTY